MKYLFSPEILELDIQNWIHATHYHHIYISVANIWPLRPLLPEEEVFMQKSIEKRRAEFSAGRYCARKALTQLGFVDIAIPRGVRGAPVWPDSIVGSITHDLGVAIAALSSTSEISALGIDLLDLCQDIDPSTAEIIAGNSELLALENMLSQTEAQVIGETPIKPLLLAFSAKESAIKSVSPTIDYYLDFRDIVLYCDDNLIRAYFYDLGKYLDVFWHRSRNALFTLSYSITS